MGESRNVRLPDLMIIAMVTIIATLFLSVIDFGSCRPARESAKRSVCAANLMGTGKAIAMYANSYRGSFPLVTAARMRDSGSPEKGLHPRPDEGTVLMFDCGQTVTAEAAGGLHRWQRVVDEGSVAKPDYPHVRLAGRNVSYAFPSRELWLLVKGNFSQTCQFVCPSTAHEGDDLRADRPNSAGHGTDVKGVLHLHDDTETVPAAKLWDFLQPDTLDYGYMFAHDANGEQANEGMDPQYPVMADSNPYIRTALTGGKVPAASNTQNSFNHLCEGQNVLFGDMHVQFFDKPTVGVGGDNIYTAWYSQAGQNGSVDLPGTAPRVEAGAAGEPPTNYHFDLVSRTDAMILP